MRKSRKIDARERKLPRSWYYKVYKTMCKMLEADCICVEALPKAGDVICTIDICGMKRPLRAEKSLKAKTVSMNLVLGKRARKSSDIQKEIVKAVLKALEKSDVWVDMPSWKGDPCIKQGTCFDVYVIEQDLKRFAK